MRITIGLAFVLTVGAGAATADAKPHRYGSIHPINAEDGMCFIEAPHVHAYAPPNRAVLFRDDSHDGRSYFVGDPVAYGWDGPRFSYHGHHPVVVGGGEAYCYLDGPHFHHVSPAVDAKFEIKGDVYWYVGVHTPRYKKELYRRKRINAVYAEFDYPRPIIVVDPPAAYAGVIVSGPSVDVHADVVVPVPSVEVVLPSLSFGIGVDHHVHHSHCEHHEYKKYKHKKYKHKKVKHRHKGGHKRGKRWKF